MEKPLLVMRREFGPTPNGNEFNGRWVLRDDRNEIIDFDQYQNDLIPRWEKKYEIVKVGK